MSRFEPSIFKKIVKNQSGKYWFLSAFKIEGRGLLFLCAVGIFFLMILGRGCTYQAHDFIGKNWDTYSKAIFKVTYVNRQLRKKYGPDASYVEGCINMNQRSYCEERIRGDSLLKVYKRSNEYEALLDAKIGDEFPVLFNSNVSKTKTYQGRNEAVRVIHADVELHKSNANWASMIGWAYLVLPILCFIALIWQIPVKERP